MTIARSRLVNPCLTPYYHCISRCVRGAGLCGGRNERRKMWIEKRLEDLVESFAISICGFAVLETHFHAVLCLPDSETVLRWSDREVVERWGRLFPPRDKRRKQQPVSEEWIAERLKDKQWIAKVRKRLASLSWFMKCLKEPLARMANREDKCRGAFWESRFKSIAILDELSLLAACVYVDLNVYAAGLASLPERSEHTSIKIRLDYCHRAKRMAELKHALQQAADGCVLSPKQARHLEEGVWLTPLGDLPRDGPLPEDSYPGTETSRPGMVPGFSLPQYLQLVDSTSRLARQGKVRMAAGASSILERLGTDASTWQTALQRMFQREREFGVTLAFSRDRLQEAAALRGCSRVTNLNGCPA